MNCPQCQAPVAADAKFCTHCGATLDPSAHKSPPPLPHPPAFPVASPADALPSGDAVDDWEGFFRSLESDELRLSRPAANRFEFSGERKIKALLSRTTLRYAAVALLDPGARCLSWWEKLSESSFGMTPQNAGIYSETRKQKGISVTVEKSVRTPGGAYTYHYGDLRAVVEAKARQSGWEFTLLVAKP